MWNRTNDIAHKNDAGKGDSKQIKNVYFKSVISKSTKFRETFDFVLYSQGPYHQLSKFYVAKNVNFCQANFMYSIKNGKRANSIPSFRFFGDN